MFCVMWDPTLPYTYDVFEDDVVCGVDGGIPVDEVGSMASAFASAPWLMIAANVAVVVATMCFM